MQFPYSYISPEYHPTTPRETRLERTEAICFSVKRGYEYESAAVICPLCPDLSVFDTHRNLQVHFLKGHCFNPDMLSDDQLDHINQGSHPKYACEWCTSTRIRLLEYLRGCKVGSEDLRKHHRTLSSVWPQFEITLSGATSITLDIDDGQFPSRTYFIPLSNSKPLVSSKTIIADSHSHSTSRALIAIIPGAITYCKRRNYSVSSAVQSNPTPLFIAQSNSVSPSLHPSNSVAISAPSEHETLESRQSPTALKPSARSSIGIPQLRHNTPQSALTSPGRPRHDSGM